MIMNGIINFFNRYKFVCLALSTVFMMAGMCRMSITEVTIPDSGNLKANQTVPIQVVGEYEPGAKGNTQVVFAILAPSYLNLYETASLTFSSSGFNYFGETDVTDIEMIPVPDGETEVSTSLDWSSAYLAREGVQGNIGGDVKWFVFRTERTFTIDDKADDSLGDDKFIIGTVKIRFNTGSRNAKFYMGFSFCGTEKGLTLKYSDTEEYGYNPDLKKVVPVEITGGEGETDDYTVLKLISTTPTVFGFGDIFAINFDAGSTFSEDDNVYLCGKAVLSDGTEKTMEEKVSKALMEKTGTSTYRRYIYPKDFFSLGQGEEISELYVWFSNEDGSKISKEGENGHQIQEAE